MSNITNYLSAIDEANQIKNVWNNQLNTLTPQNFHDAYFYTSNHLSYNKDKSSFTFQYNFSTDVGLYAVQKMKDMGFVDVVLSGGLIGNVINFKVPKPTTNLYIESINDSIFKHHEADNVLADITPKLIKDLELGLIYFKNYHKEKSGYSINLMDKLNYNIKEDQKEYMYVMNELEKMGFSNVKWSGPVIYFEIK